MEEKLDDVRADSNIKTTELMPLCSGCQLF